MGAWGPGTLDNDGALDFLMLARYGDVNAHIEALTNVITIQHYVDVDDAQMILAAGEVMALMGGQPPTTMPEVLATQHRNHLPPLDNVLLDRTITSIKKVLTHSELKDLWSEGIGVNTGFDEWQSNITNLIERLEAVRAA